MNFLLYSPYKRDTYRYTPLLALLLTPNHFLHPAFGKFLFASCDLAIGVLLLRLTTSSLPMTRANKAPLWVGALWLLNPMVANISTRGSAESILGLAVILTLFLLLSSRFDAAAIMLGFAVHFKLYPVVYGASVLAFLTPRKNSKQTWFQGLKDGAAWRCRIRFALLSVSTLFVLNGVMYSM